jgi:hypothetical protein
MEDAMRTLALGTFAIATAATLVTAAPATAQVYFGSPDVSVRFGDRHDRSDRWDRPRHRGYYAMRGGDCRMTVVRRHRPDGSVMVRRIRECD